jgi:hypothetical protein
MHNNTLTNHSLARRDACHTRQPRHQAHGPERVAATLALRPDSMSRLIEATLEKENALLSFTTLVPICLRLVGLFYQAVNARR